MRLQSLVDQVLALADSRENQRRIAKRQALLARDRSNFCPPVYVRLNRPYLPGRIDVNLSHLIHDPEAYLALEMTTKILKFTEFDEDTPLFPDVMLQLGTAWDLTLCSISWVEVDGEEPWVGPPILSNADQVDALEIPDDFSRVGMMPLTLTLYHETQRLLEGKIKVHFPDWLAGPTRVVQKLRGEEGFFLDLFDNPRGVHKMYAYATRLRRAFEAYRRRLVGTGPGPGEFYYWEFKTLANDEVNAQLLSPSHYREFVYPYDQAYCRDYQRVYFHGSGNFTPFLENINTLPNLAMIEISDWSDLAQAARTLNQNVILERTFLQTEKAFTGDTATKTRLLEQLARDAGRSFYYFILNVDNRDEGIEDKIRAWVSAARQAISNVSPTHPSNEK